MIVVTAVDIELAVLVLAVAAWTIAARQAFPAVVGYVAYGLLLSLVWVRLYAVDVALTEAAIGSGVTGVVLIGAATRLRGTEAEAAAEQPRAFLRLAAAALCVGVTVALAAAVLLMPDPAPTLAPEAVAHLPSTGLGNAVTAVLLAYRVVDTMFESVVLLLALVGVWSLAPDRDWGGAPKFPRPAGQDGVLTFFAQLLPPVGIVVGIHIVWIGADEPGGKFQGGTILAAMWIIAMTAGLVDAPQISRCWLRLVLVAGTAAFLVIGVAGFAWAAGFLAYPEGYAKPLILVIEAFMTLSVAATLGMLVGGPPQQELRR